MIKYSLVYNVVAGIEDLFKLNLLCRFNIILYNTIMSSLYNEFFLLDTMSWLRAPSNVPQVSSQLEPPLQFEFPDFNNSEPSMYEEDDCEMGDPQGDTVPGKIYKKGLGITIRNLCFW